jgi:hypothetical protein
LPWQGSDGAPSAMPCICSAVHAQSAAVAARATKQAKQAKQGKPSKASKAQAKRKQSTHSTHSTQRTASLCFGQDPERKRTRVAPFIPGAFLSQHVLFWEWPQRYDRWGENLPAPAWRIWGRKSPSMTTNGQLAGGADGSKQTPGHHHEDCGRSSGAASPSRCLRS